MRDYEKCDIATMVEKSDEVIFSKSRLYGTNVSVYQNESAKEYSHASRTSRAEGFLALALTLVIVMLVILVSIAQWRQ